MNSGRVKLNVGGTMFETSILTLTRLEGTVLQTMLEERWNGPACSHNQEIFIDRDSTHFRTILNFLRDGFFFYGIVELAEKCKAYREPIGIGDTVTWREEMIELYWKAFVRLWIDESLVLPFVYERNNHTFARCVACTEMQDPKCSYSFEYSYDIWEAMAGQMKHMNATVTQLIGKTCCLLKLSNGRLIHLPLTALRKAKRAKDSTEDEPRKGAEWHRVLSQSSSTGGP